MTPARAPHAKPETTAESAAWFRHAVRARKAGFPAPRAACLFALHKTDFRPAQGPKTGCRGSGTVCLGRPATGALDTCLAGAAGLEPATCGFGDRRSTN